MQETQKRFPILETSESLKALHQYLLFPKYDVDDNKIIIPANFLSLLEGYGQWDENYSAISYLEDYRSNVAPNITWSSWTEGKSRRILDLGWDNEYMALVAQERLGAFDNTGKVWFMSGKVVNKITVKKVRDTMQTLAVETSKANNKNADMAMITEYMNEGVATNVFTKTIERNMPDAKLAAVDMVRSLDKNARAKEMKVFDHTISILRALETYPKDYYAPVSGGTSRLFALTSGLQNLPRRIRKVLTKGWIEADLVAAQTAINASVWKVESVDTFLANDGNVWRTLITDLGLPYSDGVKLAVKKAFYRLQFGGQLSTVKGEFTKRMNDLDIPASAEAFVSHWIVRDMYEGRERFKASIVENNGARGYYGEWFSLDQHKVNTILSHVATSYEMALIAPIFELANKTDDFIITLYQFDGVSIHVMQKSRQQQVLARISKAVADKAKALGIHTKLEFESL